MAPVIKNIPEETLKAICQAYIDGEKTKTICKTYGVSTGTLSRILEIHNVPRRKAKDISIKTCRHCGTVRNPEGALYCCMCGNPMLTDKELIIKKLRDMSKYDVTMHGVFKDDYIKDIKYLLDKVEKLEVVE